MTLDLTAHSRSGDDLVALADFLAGELAVRAAQTERDASSPFHDIDTIRQWGFFMAQVPAELGGLGVDDDAAVQRAVDRLCGDDPVVAIGVEAHVTAVRVLVRRREAALAHGDTGRAAALAARMERAAAGGIVLAEAIR